MTRFVRTAVAYARCPVAVVPVGDPQQQKRSSRTIDIDPIDAAPAAAVAEH
jgi:hypothetical protein